MRPYKKGKWRKRLTFGKKFWCQRLRAYTAVGFGIIESRTTSNGGRLFRLTKSAAARINKNLDPTV